jgi:hypothetical protein
MRARRVGPLLLAWPTSPPPWLVLMSQYLYFVLKSLGATTRPRPLRAPR